MTRWKEYGTCVNPPGRGCGTPVTTLKEGQASAAEMGETVHPTTAAQLLHQAKLFGREAMRSHCWKKLILTQRARWRRHGQVEEGSLDWWDHSGASDKTLCLSDTKQCTSPQTHPTVKHLSSRSWRVDGKIWGNQEDCSSQDLFSSNNDPKHTATALQKQFEDNEVDVLESKSCSYLIPTQPDRASTARTKRVKVCPGVTRLRLCAGTGAKGAATKYGPEGGEHSCSHLLYVTCFSSCSLLCTNQFSIWLFFLFG